MNKTNLITYLEKQGYTVTLVKWGYWTGVPSIELEHCSVIFAEAVTGRGGDMGINVDFTKSQVNQIIEISKSLGKIKHPQDPDPNATYKPNISFNDLYEYNQFGKFAFQY